jgi:hypothetical protein
MSSLRPDGVAAPMVNRGGAHAMLALTGGTVSTIICTQTNIAIWQIPPQGLPDHLGTHREGEND